MSSSDEKQSTIMVNEESTAEPSSSSQVILHDPTKQKIVLYDPRSQQITFCQSRWYHYNNGEPINLSSFLHNSHNYTNNNGHNVHNGLNQFSICPMCHQRLPSIYQSTSIPPFDISSHHLQIMHRDYFMLLDRSYATDSEPKESKQSKHIDTDALNNGYYTKFFEKVKKLGSGSYGTVHLVKHVMHEISLGLFAVKIICVGDKVPRLIEILREVRALQRLHHRNVIDYKHSWLENYQPAINGPLVPTLFILMEYADCGNIMDYITHSNGNKKRKWLSEHEIYTIMFETCMGLQHLHEYGILHRDLKPNNLLMTSLHTRHRIDFEDLELYDTNYRIVLSDLGQSEFLDSNQRSERTGNTGTLGFAAPELILDGDWDESVDIWSLGHILYFLAFSKWPYDNGNDALMDMDEYELYDGILSGKYKLLIPQNNGFRSQSMIEMIDELCCIEAQKRPSLSWIILKISNILKQHQYITISSTSTQTEQMALAAPPGIKPDLSLYPVIKYVPKKKKKKHKKEKKVVINKIIGQNGGNLLRRRYQNKNRNKSLLLFPDKKEEERDYDNNDMFKMTMFAMGKPFRFIIKNGVIQMSLGLIIKMEFLFKYIAINQNTKQYVVEIYICICCVLLSFICNNNHNAIHKYKQYVVGLYGLLSIVSYLHVLLLINVDGDEGNQDNSSILKHMFMLFASEMILLCICSVRI